MFFIHYIKYGEISTLLNWQILWNILRRISSYKNIEAIIIFKWKTIKFMKLNSNIFNVFFIKHLRFFIKFMTKLILSIIYLIIYVKKFKFFSFILLYKIFMSKILRYIFIHISVQLKSSKSIYRQHQFWEILILLSVLQSFSNIILPVIYPKK